MASDTSRGAGWLVLMWWMKVMVFHQIKNSQSQSPPPETVHEPPQVHHHHLPSQWSSVQ